MIVVVVPTVVVERGVVADTLVVVVVGPVVVEAVVVAGYFILVDGWSQKRYRLI